MLAKQLTVTVDQLVTSCRPYICQM